MNNSSWLHLTLLIPMEQIREFVVFHNIFFTIVVFSQFWFFSLPQLHNKLYTVFCCWSFLVMLFSFPYDSIDHIPGVYWHPKHVKYLTFTQRVYTYIIIFQLTSITFSTMTQKPTQMQRSYGHLMNLYISDHIPISC